MQDRLVVQNQGMRSVSLELGIEVACDFADIFAVKDYDFALGDPEHAEPLPPLVKCVYDEENNQFLLEDETGVPARTQVILSRKGEVDDCKVSYRLDLEPRERWDLRLDIVPLLDGPQVVPRMAERRFGDELARVRESLAAWQLRVPQLRATWDDLAHSFGRSVSDLASLRMHGREDGVGKLPAAGMPWFMTVFGRDTIITCLQTLLFGPELAVTALQVLGDLQATTDDPVRDAEPGKIVHELRRGKAAHVARHLLRHRRRDAALPHPALRGLALDRRREPRREPQGAGAAGARVDRQARRPRRRRLRRVPEAQPPRARQPVVEGLARLPAVFRRTDCGAPDRRLRGPGLRLRREGPGRRAGARSGVTGRSQSGWSGRRRSSASGSTRLSGRTSAAATTCSRSTAEKNQVDSLCSNVGHLLWSGIVPNERVDAVVDQMMGDSLWSGWGIRTMSTLDRAYNPLAYHNGTVWPHDNSLCAWGLARYGRWPEAHRIVRQMLTAARHFDYQLPEVFAGGPRRVSDRLSDCRAPPGLGGRNAGAPPPASAWAQPRSEAEHARVGGAARAAGVGWIPQTVQRESIRPALGSSAGGRTGDGATGMNDEQLRIAIVSPPWFPVPPSGYGGIEWVVALLADGLAEAGHDVTLFASGDSQTKAKLSAVFETAPSEWIGRSHFELLHTLPCYTPTSSTSSASTRGCSGCPRRHARSPHRPRAADR